MYVFYGDEKFFYMFIYFYVVFFRGYLYKYTYFRLLMLILNITIRSKTV